MSDAKLLEDYRAALMSEVAEVHRLRELLWKTHRPTCPSVQDAKPCDCGALAFVEGATLQ